MIHRSKFLVIVDDSDELNVAIRFAAKRAQSTKGGVILLNIIEPVSYTHLTLPTSDLV